MKWSYCFWLYTYALDILLPSEVQAYYNESQFIIYEIESDFIPFYSFIINNSINNTINNIWKMYWYWCFSTYFIILWTNKINIWVLVVLDFFPFYY